MRSRLLAAVAAGTVSLLGPAGCASAPTPADSGQPPPPASATLPLPSSNPYGGATIDPPAAAEPVLTVKGGSAPTLSLTLDALNALGSRTVTLDEPFVKRRETYAGVPLAAVLDKAGIPDSATIDTIGLDDYHYISTAKPMIESQALIATDRDGAPIPYNQGGPIRIVFPDGTPLSSVLDAWNWSLASITVKAPSGPGS
ncbi:molybdopterin-dependent oxidoreductase [Mycobacterium sp. RTGN5]|uniref:molybdopterin-dependent oxidoreductase n=1 Tax=Mycobacterium sp. RTGN5 TaxID=3016522 RepID=UPI0029C653C1|nr:molybdopterin-dependent oxidoreductase [Mycobacterium sp. RTGN5]